MKFKDVVLVAAKRTPIGKFLGGLSAYKASDLSALLIKSILQDLKIDPAEINEVIIGQVLTTGTGQNPARQAAVCGGLPYAVPAFTVDQVCGSGLKSVCIATTLVAQDPSLLVIAGGQESMSNAPHFACLRANKQKLGNIQLIDSMVYDGLTDAFHSYHMGVTAESLAKRFSIPRAEQDEFAVSSHNKAENATKSGLFKQEIVPVEGLDKDELIRYGATLKTVSELKPAFVKSSDGGTVTAGNSSGINDGASTLLIASGEAAQKRNIPILAKVVSYAQTGLEPESMGMGPVGAVKKALSYAGWSIDELDCIESNEAFAVQSIVVNKELRWDLSKVNTRGGAIALGHPIGASGARCLTSLVHNMYQNKLRKGIVALCIGGGMGIAMCVECGSV